MFITIKEKISVLGIYQQANFIPKKFQWQRKTYAIESITLVSDIKEGTVNKRMYAVISTNRLHRLLFNRHTETWTLEEIWSE